MVEPEDDELPVEPLPVPLPVELEKGYVILESDDNLCNVPASRGKGAVSE